MESFFQYICYELSYVEAVFQKWLFSRIPAPKKVQLLKKYMVRMITYSEEVASLTQDLCWKSIYLQESADQKKYLLPRKNC